MEECYSENLEQRSMVESQVSWEKKEQFTREKQPKKLNRKETGKQRV